METLDLVISVVVMIAMSMLIALYALRHPLMCTLVTVVYVQHAALHATVCPCVHYHHHATRDVILQMSHLGVMDLVVIFRLRGTQDGGADGQTGLRLHPIPRALLCRDCGG